MTNSDTGGRRKSTGTYAVMSSVSLHQAPIDLFNPMWLNGKQNGTKLSSADSRNLSRGLANHWGTSRAGESFIGQGVLVATWAGCHGGLHV